MRLWELALLYSAGVFLTCAFSDVTEGRFTGATVLAYLVALYMLYEFCKVRGVLDQDDDSA